MAGAVFFDLWNTLIYCPTRDRVEEIIRLTGIKEGYEEFMAGVRVNTFANKSVRFSDYVRTCMSGRGIAYDDELVARVEGLWRSRLDNTTVFPETEEVLTDLRRDHKLGLISNLDASGAEYFRRNFKNLEGLFDVVLLSCEVGLVKPDVRIIRKALDDVGVKAADAWMVGDRMQDDIAVALKSGVNPILVDREGKASKRDFPSVRSLREVRGIVEGR